MPLLVHYSLGKFRPSCQKRHFLMFQKCSQTQWILVKDLNNRQYDNKTHYFQAEYKADLGNWIFCIFRDAMVQSFIQKCLRTFAPWNVLNVCASWEQWKPTSARENDHRPSFLSELLKYAAKNRLVHTRVGQLLVYSRAPRGFFVSRSSA